MELNYSVAMQVLIFFFCLNVQPSYCLRWWLWRGGNADFWQTGRPLNVLYSRVRNAEAPASWIGLLRFRVSSLVHLYSVQNVQGFFNSYSRPVTSEPSCHSRCSSYSYNSIFFKWAFCSLAKREESSSSCLDVILQEDQIIYSKTVRCEASKRKL